MHTRIVAALRAGEPGAIAALFDAHATDLFRYSWFILRSREAAQIAVRDALAVAAAHAAVVRDPGQLREWLYALTRVECARRRPNPAASADVPPARPSQADADGRVLAWNAVTSMDPASAEVLELTTRHGMPVPAVAIVLGRPCEETAELLEAARVELVAFLGAYLLTRKVGLDCPVLTSAIQGWAGILTVPVRDRVLAHTENCPDCHRHLPRNVSAARVYDLLPDPMPDDAMRSEVLDWFADPRHDGYRSFAAARAAGAALAVAGGPHQDDQDTVILPVVAEPPRQGRRRPGRRLGVGLAAASIAAAAAAIFAFTGLPGSTPQATVGTPPLAGGIRGPAVTGPVTRPGAIGAVPVRAHGTRSHDPFGQPVLALYLATTHQDPPSGPPSPAGHGGGHSRHTPPARTPTPVPTWQRAPSPTPTSTPSASPSASPPTPSQTPSPSGS
jgi:DNA-directed RNA polymerase specialized sigma24 family protein